MAEDTAPLVSQLERLRGLLEEAEQYRRRLPEVGRWVKKRERAARVLGGGRRREAAARSYRLRDAAIRDYYAGFGQLLEAVRSAGLALRGWLPAREVERFLAGLERHRVGPTVEALGEFVARVEEFARAYPAPLPGADSAEARRQRLKTFLAREAGARQADVYRSAGVDKSDFYRWLRGQLPASSRRSRRIEEVLAGRRRLALRRE